MALINTFQNTGIYVQEQDRSLQYNRGVFYGLIHLVVGFSAIGPQNQVILVRDKAQFLNTFGDVDSKQERKGCYFHRTCLKMLETGPVWCLSVLNVDELDFLNWQSFSVNTTIPNINSRSTQYRRFWDQSGSWKLDRDLFLNIVQQQTVPTELPLLSFLNTKNEPVSIFCFKSNLEQFQIRVDDWYANTEIPEYLDPTDWIQDYMVRVLFLKGDWSNYLQLSRHPEWNLYFNETGLRKSQVDRFLMHRNVNVIKDYHLSLIPWFRDRAGNDLFIESKLNQDFQDHGIFTVYNWSKIEEQPERRLIDLIGHNLSLENRGYVDFLSYRENLLDQVLIQESTLSEAENSWGDPHWDVQRPNFEPEGHVNNVALKSTIFSTTSTDFINPLQVHQDSWAILNSQKIDLSNQITFPFRAQDLLTPGTKMALAAVLTTNGVDYRTSDRVSLGQTIKYPNINYATELILGWWEIEYTYQGNIVTEAFGVAAPVQNQDFNLFKDLIKVESGINQWQLKLRFPNYYTTSQNYYDVWVQHQFQTLNTNLVENQSIILDDRGWKQIIEQVEIYREQEDVVVALEVKNKSNLVNISQIAEMDFGPAIFYRDIEFVLQNEGTATQQSEPYQPGQGGIIGKDSWLYQAYYNGEISSGDRIFKQLFQDVDAEFIKQVGADLLVIPESVPLNQTQLWIWGADQNDGYYNVIAEEVRDGKRFLQLEQEVALPGKFKIGIFDATQETYITFYFVGSQLHARYETKQLNTEAILRKTLTQNKKIRETIDIIQHIDDKTILVEYERYQAVLKEGGFLSQYNAEDTTRPRGLTRIVEIYPYNDKLLYVKTEDPIQTNMIWQNGNLNLQTFYFLSIDDWVTTYKAAVLKPFIVRETSKPNGTEEQIRHILEGIAPGTGLHKHLANPNAIEWRYLIDCWGFGVNPETKKNLAEIARKHFSFAFLNAPSVKNLIDNNQTIFKVDGALEVNLLIKGGQKTGVDSAYFSLINEPDASWVGYFFPHVRITDNRLNRPMTVPPAAWVADTFVRTKWLSNQSGHNPTMACAGFRLSQLADVYATEMAFTEIDARSLENFGLNTIISYNNRYFIHSNRTAATLNSALRFINVRETLIEIERAVRQILVQHQWRFNVEEVLDEILQQIDDVLETYREIGAINAYQSSYVRDLRDTEIAVFDILLEPIPAMQALVLNLTVLKTGQITSGNFFI